MPFKVTRGKRRSVVIEVGRVRVRAVLGRFVWAWDRQDGFGAPAGALSLKWLLITYLVRAHA